MENNEPKNQPAEIDVPTALSSLAREVVRLDARTLELKAAKEEQWETLTTMTATLERIMANHTIAFRRIHGLLVGLGADFAGEELKELRSMFNLETPEGDKGPKQN